MAKKKAAPTSDLLQRIIERHKLAADASEEQRAQSLKDLNFCDVDKQWPAAIKQQRDEEGRPCLVVDRLTPFINQLANDQRMNRQGLKASPTDDGANEETAEVIEGMFRHIEYDSDADVAYDRAALAQLRGGFGYLRVYTEYENEESFDQVVKIGSIANPFLVYTDPASILPDGSDMEWAMIECDYAADDYRQRWPNSRLSAANPSQWESIGDSAPGWIGDGGKACRVVEYFERTRKKTRIVRHVDGTNKKEDPANPFPPEEVVDSRDSSEIEVKWVKANALEILEETIWPSKWIPIVPVYGQELIVDGKVIYFGLIRQMADIQKMHNFWKSAQTEAIALAPKAPWVAPAEAIANYESVWKNSNRRNYTVLPYNAFDGQRNPIPPPQRIVQEPAIMAITQAIVGTEEDFKATTGMYDPSLGNRGSADQSGVAIGRLQNQGQLSNFHFPDNLNRSRRHLGRIILDVIKKVYTGPRIIRIIGQDDTSSLVTINQPHTDPKTGTEKVFDVTTGTYDVVIASGPSYQTKRQENLTTMVQLLHEIPQLGQVGADLIVSQLDFPMAEELQERLKMALPPQFQKPQNGQPPVPPQVQAQMQQLSQHAQMQDAALHDLMDKLTQAQQEKESKESENAVKLQIAAIQAETALRVAELNGQSKLGLAAFQGQLDQFQSVLDGFIAKDATLDDHAHEYAMASDPAVNGQMQMGQGQAAPAGPAPQPQGAPAPDDAGPSAGGGMNV